MESCKLFLERARKRVEWAQAVVDRAREQKALYEAEAAEGEARYAKLLAEATCGLGRVRGGHRFFFFFNLRSSQKMDWRPSHFRHARSRKLGEPTQLRSSQCDGVRGSSSRCQDWQFGGTRGNVFSTAVRDASMEGQNRSPVMSDLIDEADSKRRCVTPGSASGPKQ